MSKPKTNFIEASYIKMKDAILNIDSNIIEDIYALSFYYDCIEDDDRHPIIYISYNTISNYEENIAKASSASEAKWNFAFWLQDTIAEIGGEDKLLAIWFNNTPYFYSEKENKKAEDDDDLFEELLEKGGMFTHEFFEEIILLINRLFNEKIIETKFGKNIPVLMHELEIFDTPIDRTVRSNPKGLVDEFLKWAIRS